MVWFLGSKKSAGTGFGRLPERIRGRLVSGAAFRGQTEGRTPEIARILDIRRDEFGVHHIRFVLTYCYQDKTMEAGERTLSLAAFIQRFPTPQDEPAARNGGADEEPAETPPEGST